MFETIEQLPEHIKATYKPDEQAEYLRIYNAVFQQTQDAVKASAAAIGAVTKMRGATPVRSLRSAANGDITAGGWMMKFSDALDRDAYKTFFDTATDLMLEYYPTAPLWMEHGLDNQYGGKPIGKRSAVQIYGFGVWGEHTVYANHPLFDETKQGIENGEFCYSSDSIQHYAEQGFNPADGRMGLWPFAGCSLTREPAEESLGPVTMRAFKSQVQTFLSSIPSDLEAREAQGTTENLFTVRKSSQGEKIMDPAQLASLAEMLGCDATPEAVSAALQQLITQINQQPAAGAQPDPTAVAAQTAMVNELRSGLALPETAKAADVAAKLESIRSLLKPPTSRTLKMGALKKFMGLVEANLEQEDEGQDPIPFAIPARADRSDADDYEEDYRPASRRFGGEREGASRSRQVAFRHIRGAAKPGLLDVIGALSQLSGGSTQFEMPAFKSRRSSPQQALRAMNVNNAQSGGWMLNREMSNEILEALYAELVFDRLGAKMIPMQGTESVTMNRVQSGAVAYWAGQGQSVSDANAKISAAVTLQTKELVSKSIIENKLLRNSAGNMIENMVQDDIIRVMKLRMELAFLYGTGGVPVAAGNSGAEPLGLKNTTGVTSTSLVSKNPAIKDLTDAEGRIEDANIDYTELQWLSHKRARRYFKGMTDALGKPLFSEDWITNDIKELIVNDHPFVTTTQIPLTTSGQTVTTDIFLGDWTQMLIGQGVDLEVVVDTSRYVEERSTLIQVVSYVDAGVAYKEAFQVLTLAKV